MKTAVLFDCEFLCLEESQARFWCAAEDPDPVIAQIGAVQLGLEADFPLLQTYRAFVRPVDRFGRDYRLDEFFTALTGITEADIQEHGVCLEQALAGFDRFAAGSSCWSWGKDELNMVAISCYVAGIAPPIPAHRFDNAVKLMVAAGMPREDIARTRSDRLAGYFGVEHPPLQAHDALGDALSMGYALQHLLRTGRLSPEAFGDGMLGRPT